jgi:hypothetical protein
MDIQSKSREVKGSKSSPRAPNVHINSHICLLRDIYSLPRSHARKDRSLSGSKQQHPLTRQSVSPTQGHSVPAHSSPPSIPLEAEPYLASNHITGDSVHSGSSTMQPCVETLSSPQDDLPAATPSRATVPCSQGTWNTQVLRLDSNLHTFVGGGNSFKPPILFKFFECVQPFFQTTPLIFFLICY